MRRHFSYKRLVEEAKKKPAFWTEKFSNQFLNELLDLMAKQGISRSQLAKKIEKNPSYITKIFRGNVNFTLSTMVSLAMAVNSQLSLEIIPTKAITDATKSLEKEEQLFSTIVEMRKTKKTFNINDLRKYKENLGNEELLAA